MVLSQVFAYCWILAPDGGIEKLVGKGILTLRMEKAGTRVFLVYVFVSLCLLFLDLRGNLVFLKSGSSYVISPFYFASSNSRDSLRETFSFLTFWKSGEKRIRYLEQSNLELLVKATRTDQLERENRVLREQLGVASLASRKMLPAKVVGVGRFLVLGVGLNEGVKVGQMVVIKDVLVGRVLRATDKLSYVILPTDGSSKIPAHVSLKESVRGLVIGQYNSSIVLDQIVQMDKVVENQLILTSGDEGSYEPGLLIGKVGKVLSSETDLFKKVEVQPIIVYGKLHTVFVVLN